MAGIYTDQHDELGTLLAKASNDEGASLLIPDLQRPFEWIPLQVIRLVDSLIRGWPFGTFLTWKIHKDDPVQALARSFWKIATGRRLATHRYCQGGPVEGCKPCGSLS